MTLKEFHEVFSRMYEELSTHKNSEELLELDVVIAANGFLKPVGLIIADDDGIYLCPN